MSVKSAPEVAVVASTPLAWAFGGAAESVVSLLLGLLMVLLTRMIFVNQENRALGYRQPWRETVPITLAGCLIAGGVIWDQHLSYSGAILTGAGAGWSTLVIIKGMSRVINPADAARQQGEHGPHLEPLSEGHQPPPVSRALHQTYPVAERLPIDHARLVDDLRDDTDQE